jgi:hypothetical protein
MGNPPPSDPNGIQPGFGFQPGQLIPTAPLIFPGEQDLFMLLEFTAEYAGYFGAIGYVISIIAEVIIVILQLIDELVSIFEGKPRAQDTLTVAHRLANGQSPVAHLMSVQIGRNLDQNNIVLSSSDPNDQQVLGHIRTQAQAMLVAQGVDAARAKQVVDEVWTQTIDKNQKLPAELDQPIDPRLIMIGPQQLQQEFINHYNSRIRQGLDPLKAGQLATNWIYQNGKLGDLGKIQIRLKPLIPIPGHLCPAGSHWDDTQQTCIPDTPTNCPPGFIWDPPTQTCVPNPNPPPPGQPGPCPPWSTLPDCFPPPPTPDQDLDEVGQLGQMSAWGFEVIAIAILNVYQELIGASNGGSTPDPVTCTQLTAQVALITTALEAISTAITNVVPGGPTPFDPTAIIAALTAIATAITNAPPPAPVEPPPSDPSVSEFVQKLADDGFFAPDVSQLITS